MTGLRANSNNRASTVLEMFLDAILAYGIPSRMRGDHGGKNQDVAILMILLRGSDRGSYLWGSSTHNSCIERMWVEIGTQFACQWRAFFCRLKAYHHLDQSNSHHLWLLHTLLLEQINQDCDQFRQNWNSHPISGKGKNQSPNVRLQLIPIMELMLLNIGYSTIGTTGIWRLRWWPWSRVSWTI